MRCPVPAEYLERDELKFQLLDYLESYEKVPFWPSADDQKYIAKNHSNYIRSTNKYPDEATQDCEIALFGRTCEGYSVCVKAKTYPVLVVRLHNANTRHQAQEIVNYIVEKKHLVEADMTWDLEYLHDAGGFHPEKESKTPKLAKYPFLKLAFRTMMKMWVVRGLLCKRNPRFVDDGKREQPKYLNEPVDIGRQNQYRVEVVEKSIPVTLQFLQACGVTPSSIVSVDLKKFHRQGRFSHCDIEGSVHIPAFGRYSPIKGEPNATSKVYPFTVHSFDIECVAPGGGFPDAENPEDKIVCIASTTHRFGTGETLRVVHGLIEYADFSVMSEGKDCAVICKRYDSEMELLEGWRDHVVMVEDPDMFTGYNIDRFDWAYMHRRAMRFNKDSRFFFFGRLVLAPCKFVNTVFESKAYGSNESVCYTIPGRINFDLYTYMKRNFSLDSYGLGAVSRKFLKDDKEDLPIKVMMQYSLSGDPRQGLLVMKYCLKDTELPIRLIQTLRILFLQVEMSRVCTVFMSDLFSRGQMFKVLSQFFIFARKEQFVLSNLPDYAKLGIDTYQGAMVLECTKGFFEDCLVLDFASLYPSIMIAQNLCYCSWVKPTDLEKNGALEQFSYFDCRTDLGVFRFQTSIEGLLPKLLKHLLAARKVAKRDMLAADRAGDNDLKELMNGRQLALKVSCNSVYGFTGAASFGAYACPPIAASVTAHGRFLIQETIRHVQTDYASEQAQVIYGDTDSVFVTVAEKQSPEQQSDRQQFLFELGERMGREISAKFPPAITLEFEKVYLNFILMSKKCYTGLKFENLHGKGKVEAKGFSVVRRDFCLFVRELLQGMVDAVVINRDVAGAIQLLEAKLTDLVNDRVPYEKIILSCKLAASYKNPNVIQNKVAKVMNERTPGFGPQPGDRVQYVVVQNKQSNHLFDKGEDWEYAKENKIPIDYGYYMECLQSPIEKLFCVFPFATRQRLSEVFKHFTGVIYRRQNNLRSLDETFGWNNNPPIEKSTSAAAADAVQKKKQNNKKGERPRGCADLAVLFKPSTIQSNKNKKPTPSPKVSQSATKKQRKAIGGNLLQQLKSKPSSAPSTKPRAV